MISCIRVVIQYHYICLVSCIKTNYDYANNSAYSFFDEEFGAAMQAIKKMSTKSPSVRGAFTMAVIQYPILQYFSAGLMFGEIIAS